MSLPLMMCAGIFRLSKCHGQTSTEENIRFWPSENVKVSHASLAASS